ncbi:MAG: Flp pilus assembly complex ATPase component TadA [Anaerolineae bacterium]|nr:Flp pilus assembly complex ATPase component TadA [Anaerolineae bacterium]
MTENTKVIVDDIDALLHVMPKDLKDALVDAGHRDDLLEVILDLGRVPTARYVDGEIILRKQEVKRKEIKHVVENIGLFDADNRSGITRTLHRIAAIRNREGDIVGLTCRVGRAVYGTIRIIEDLVESGGSILLLGPPGVGKTTMLREAARVLAEKKRVVIVDTSNEIGGDGDIPHPAVGRARRMQVAVPNLQHEVMIEAVENHNPEVIVIDEIGRELEALAARTIAERGVQLIATAHGRTLDNLLLNPTLSDLVGGIESVTLSDEEARRRGTQKTVLERRAPPTFDILIEMVDRQRLMVHDNVATAVDALLRGKPVPAELREVNAAGKIEKDKVIPAGMESRNGNGVGQPMRYEPFDADAALYNSKRKRRKLRPAKVYPFGVARNRLMSAAKSLQVPLTMVDSLGEADVLVTTKHFYRRKPRVVTDAERRGTSIYVLRANTVAQMESFLAEFFQLSEAEDDAMGRAVCETEEAISRILKGAGSVELAPQQAFIRRQQHQMASAANLASQSTGKDPDRRVRIYQPDEDEI